ncbi:hypothetical protein GJS26_02951 [Pectobacterium carotovorum subsp. carotovorum]|uniref:Spore coat protein U n=3 Tax=Enterobacterales TaxID=91347 RepID=A0A855MN35_9GAMM|nr:hypothetical protein [Pectobacterium carotovorum subsp. carotovorum]POY50708.1 spore coat protein U [Pectobacterium versatile]
MSAFLGSLIHKKRSRYVTTSHTRCCVYRLRYVDPFDFRRFSCRRSIYVTAGIAMRFSSVLILPFLLSGTIVPKVAMALTVSSTFDVTATIQKGCVFGTSTASSQPNMGTLNFGTRSATATNVDIASTSGGGSIIATCTPGISAVIELSYGTNGGDSTQRYLKNAAGTRLLAYQLYRDAARTQVWGTGGLALNIASFPATTQTYTVYARYFGGTPLPPAGVYTDNVTVSLTY